MKNSLLIAIVTEDSSDTAITIAEREGIKGVTRLPASGISSLPTRTFFGLTFQESMATLLWIAPTEVANRAAKALSKEMKLESPRQGLALTLNIDQLHGIDL